MQVAELGKGIKCINLGINEEKLNVAVEHKEGRKKIISQKIGEGENIWQNRCTLALFSIGVPNATQKAYVTSDFNAYL